MAFGHNFEHSERVEYTVKVEHGLLLAHLALHLSL